MGETAKRLTLIQNELNAPKNLFNSYGKYKYRNFESICEAVKPLLKKYDCTLFVEDTIEQIGERYYIKATVTFGYADEGVIIKASAYARESLDKKGMDDSQITGTASSYARKYAMNGLFLIDDTKDPDTNEYHEQTNVTPVQLKALQNTITKKGIDEKEILSKVGLKSWKGITPETYNQIVTILRG